MQYNAFDSSYELPHASRLRRSLRFAKRHHKKAYLILAGIILFMCIASVVVQLLYPRDRTLPVTALGGNYLTFQDTNAVKKQLLSYDDHSLVVKIGPENETVTPAKVGMTFVSDDNIQQVLSYPFAMRFIPFSLFFQNKIAVQKSLKPTLVSDSLRSYSTSLAQKNNAKPIEGVITVDNATVSEHAPKPGRVYTSDKIFDSLRNITAALPSTITISGQSVPPVYTANAVHVAAIKATEIVKPFTLTVDGNDFTIPAETIGSWLTFTPEPTTKAIIVDIDTAAAKTYLATVASKVYSAPTPSAVTLLDNQEIARQDGTSGNYLDTTATANAISEALSQNQLSLAVQMKPISPPINYARTYTNSQAGLQALLDFLASSKGDYGIAVHEMSARGWSANNGGDKDYVTASTYKLFVAYSTLLRIENGTYHWSDQTLDTDLTTCFTRMIVNSDNACATALGERVSWNTVFSEVKGLGLSSTYQGSDTFHSTANDEALLLQKISAGDILNASDRSFLLNLMSRQVYRQGIPAGAGVPVADKVGFLWGYLHDAAVVYSPSSTYVLVIMTNNSSWSQIADTARQIQTQMAR